MGPFRRALSEKFRETGTAVIGVLNVTPDSFFDGGLYDGEHSSRRVRELVAEGAFVLDIGGESTRPGAAAVPAAAQLERIEPAVKAALAESGLWVSVDTTDPFVAETVLSWGAHIINDVSCLTDPDLARVVSRAGATLMLMHARGPMLQMPGFSDYPEDGYGDVVKEVIAEWTVARDAAVAQGLSLHDILFDPGIGFAKSAQHSMDILRRLDEFDCLGTPIVVGPSRKSFLNLVEPTIPQERLGASVAACLSAAERGAMLVRVHDVNVVRQALLAWRVLRNPRSVQEPVGGGVATLSSVDRATKERPCSKAS